MHKTQTSVIKLCFFKAGKRRHKGTQSMFAVTSSHTAKLLRPALQYTLVYSNALLGIDAGFIAEVTSLAHHVRSICSGSRTHICRMQFWGLLCSFWSFFHFSSSSRSHVQCCRGASWISLCVIPSFPLGISLPCFHPAYTDASGEGSRLIPSIMLKGCCTAPFSTLCSFSICPCSAQSGSEG